MGYSQRHKGSFVSYNVEVEVVVIAMCLQHNTSNND